MGMKQQLVVIGDQLLLDGKICPLCLRTAARKIAAIEKIQPPEPGSDNWPTMVCIIVPIGNKSIETM